MIKNVVCPEQASSDYVSASQATIPDIVFEPADGVVLRSGLTGKSGNTSDILSWRPGRIDNLQGTHLQEGMILGAGPVFSKGSIPDSNLYDIAPTVMAACGLGVPLNLVGKPIAEMLDPNVQVKYDTDIPEVKRNIENQSDAYSCDDEEEIGRRLRDLGYID